MQHYFDREESKSFPDMKSSYSSNSSLEGGHWQNWVCEYYRQYPDDLPTHWVFSIFHKHNHFLWTANTTHPKL